MAPGVFVAAWILRDCFLPATAVFSTVGRRLAVTLPDNEEDPAL
jgi:hypothetical protein